MQCRHYICVSVLTHHYISQQGKLEQWYEILSWEPEDFLWFWEPALRQTVKWGVNITMMSYSFLLTKKQQTSLVEANISPTDYLHCILTTAACTDCFETIGTKDNVTNTQRKPYVLYMAAMANHLLCPALVVKTPMWNLPFLPFFFNFFLPPVLMSLWTCAINLETLISAAWHSVLQVPTRMDSPRPSDCWAGGMCCQNHSGITLGLHNPSSSSTPRARGTILSVAPQPLSRRTTGMGEDCSHHNMSPFWAPPLPASAVVSPSSLISQQLSRLTYYNTPYRKDISTWKLNKEM